MESYRSNYSHVLDPFAEIRADGWKSDIGTLVQHGWEIELQDRQEFDACELYLRNPSKNMVGHCRLDKLNPKFAPSSKGTMIAYMDEQILLQATMHREMHIPKMELFSVEVGRPTRPIESMTGQEYEWDMYTADKQETEIIVTPEKVPFLLEAIREAQMPRAKEIIHSQHRREYQKLEAKATILAFG